MCSLLSKCGMLLTKKKLHNPNIVKNTFNMVVISANGILQKQQYVHGLKYVVTIVPHSVVPIILHEFQNCRVIKGTFHTSEVIRKSHWWPNLCPDVVKYINK